MRISESDWTILNTLWKKWPATAREVHAALPPGVDWAYSTVKTLLDRQVEKGWIRSEKAGLAANYTPVLSREAAQKSSLAWLLEKGFDGLFGSLAAHLADNDRLSESERKRLAELLAKLDEGKTHGA